MKKSLEENVEAEVTSVGKVTANSHAASSHQNKKSNVFKKTKALANRMVMIQEEIKAAEEIARIEKKLALRLKKIW